MSCLLLSSIFVIMQLDKKNSFKKIKLLNSLEFMTRMASLTGQLDRFNFFFLVLKKILKYILNQTIFLLII
jgi:hypothetical protein